MMRMTYTCQEVSRKVLKSRQRTIVVEGRQPDVLVSQVLDSEGLQRVVAGSKQLRVLQCARVKLDPGGIIIGALNDKVLHASVERYEKLHHLRS